MSSVKEKRALRARLAIGDHTGLETAKRVSDIEDRVRADLRAAEKALRSAEQALAKARSLRRDFQEAERNCARANEVLGGADDLDDLERRADLGRPVFPVPPSNALLGRPLATGNGGRPRRDRRLQGKEWKGDSHPPLASADDVNSLRSSNFCQPAGQNDLHPPRWRKMGDRVPL